MKIVTISGASGSGKSTLAQYVNEKTAGSLLLSLDRYYLSKDEQLEKNGFFNFDDPASVDVELLRNHLQDLKQHGEANVPIYDFTVSERAGYETVSASHTVIIDGLFAGDLLSLEADLSIFVDVDLDLALLRRIERDMAERGRSLQSVTAQYREFVRPAYFKHIEKIKYRSDYIIANNLSEEQLIADGRRILEYLSGQSDVF